MAPASVGVKAPDKMPPMMMTGMKIAGMARRVARPRAAQPTRGDGWAPAPGAIHQASTIMDRPARMPGNTPPRNNAPIDTPVTEP